MKDSDILSGQMDIKLLDTMSDLIRVVDENNEVIFVNEAMRRVQGMDIGLLCPAGDDGNPNGLCDFRMTARCLASGENIQREVLFEDKYYSVKTNPIRSSKGKIVGAIEVFRDKSMEKNLQVELIEKNRSLIEEQMAAANIQQALLPRRGYTEKMHMDFFYRPAEVLSGDFFDLLEVDEHHTVIYIADTVGHGFASSMVNMFISQTMRNLDPEILIDPTVAIVELGERFRDLHLPETIYFTMFLGVYCDTDRSFTYVNAGHDCPPLLKRKNRVRLLLNSGFPVSRLVQGAFYECRKAYLKRGDELLFYTDGITECRDQKQRQFGVEALRELFSGDEPSMLEHIVHTLEDYIHQDIVDDMSCVYIRMI